MNDEGGVRRHIAAEVRAEIARQDKAIGQAARVLRKSRQVFWRRYHGNVDYTAGELFVLADWLGVDVQQFLPAGYALYDAEAVAS